MRIERLAQVPDVEITKANLKSFIENASPFARVFLPVFSVIIFLGLFVGSLSTFAYLVFGALVVWAVARIKKVPAGYRMSYQIAIHAVTLPFLLHALALLFGKGGGGTLGTVLVAVIAWINLSPEEHASETTPASP